MSLSAGEKWQHNSQPAARSQGERGKIQIYAKKREARLLSYFISSDKIKQRIID